MNSHYMISHAIQFGRTQCAKGGSETALLDAQLLLQQVLGCDRQYLYMHPEQILSETQWQQFRELVELRRQGQPLAYLTGQREFWSLPLEVNPSTLIPRPDTEILVEHALHLELPPTARVLELGTGTGAIALALASERPDWQIIAVDKIAEAVELAQRNADRLDLPNVQIMLSDWFSALSGQLFDLVVTNPPYIDPSDPHLQQGDVRYEPHSALVAADNGLADIRYIIQHGPKVLLSNGWLMIEHGFSQGSKVREIFSETGYEKVNTLTDYASLDRVTYGQWRGR